MWLIAHGHNLDRLIHLQKDDERFTPRIREILHSLSTNPKQYPKKSGKLSIARAVRLKYAGIEYRLVFTLDEARRIVTILAIDRHDDAYRRALRLL